MAYTSIERSFWTDPEMRQLPLKDRYLYLYLLTNHHAHYSGVYFLPFTYITEEAGLSNKEISSGFKNLKDKLMYDNQTKVVWMINMFKYQYGKGGNPKVIFSGIEKHFQNIHSYSLKREFILKYRGVHPTLNQGWFKVGSRLVQPYGTDTVVDTDDEADTEVGTEVGTEEIKIPYQEIVNYLNLKLGTKYQSSSDETQKLIKARFNQGFKLADFKIVIDKKALTWANDAQMSAYLRPSTLFGNKFEGYLNEKITLAGQGKISAKLNKGMSAIENFKGDS